MPKVWNPFFFKWHNFSCPFLIGLNIMMTYSVHTKYISAMIQQPRVPSSGLMPASDVLIRANEVGNFSSLLPAFVWSRYQTWFSLICLNSILFIISNCSYLNLQVSIHFLTPSSKISYQVCIKSRTELIIFLCCSVFTLKDAWPLHCMHILTSCFCFPVLLALVVLEFYFGVRSWFLLDKILYQSSLDWHFDTFGMGPGLHGAGLAQAPSCWIGWPWTGEAFARMLFPFFLACRTYWNILRLHPGWSFSTKMKKKKKGKIRCFSSYWNILRLLSIYDSSINYLSVQF